MKWIFPRDVQRDGRTILLYHWRCRSLRWRGTRWIWTWGTLWLTRLLMATKVPSAAKPSAMARSSSWAFWNKGPTREGGRSASVSRCAFGTSRQWPGKRGLRSKKAREMLSSKTIEACSSLRMMRQNAHVWLSCGRLRRASGIHTPFFVRNVHEFAAIGGAGFLHDGTQVAFRTL